MFEGDNGGATSQGVTGTEIRLAFPVGSDSYWLQALLLTEWFNQRYEFYGRRLVPVQFEQLYGATDPVKGRAISAQMASSNIFGTIDMFRGIPTAYYAANARAHIVTAAVGYEQLLDDRTSYDELHPYLWGVYPSIEQVWKNLSSFVCTSLAGRPARHAPDYAQTTRKFGVLAQGDYRTPYLAPLEQGLAACGVDLAVAKVDTASAESSVARRSALESFKAAGVTTMICACMDSSWASVGYEAINYGYRPEFLHPMFSFGPGDEESIMQYMPEEFQQRSFGITPTQHIQPYQALPWFPLHFALMPEGSTDGQDHDPKVMEVMYRQVQILAAGIQMAGPNLTPESFAAGLMAAQFPNAGAGAAPLYQPSVGFGVGDHTFFNDYALTWYSPTAEAYQWGASSKQGSWCYMDRGHRYTVGNFPTDADERFLSPREPCR